VVHKRKFNKLILDFKNWRKSTKKNIPLDPSPLLKGKHILKIGGKAQKKIFPLILHPS
jgi:hypothetical protein